jgi:hypothetical protein
MHVCVCVYVYVCVCVRACVVVVRETRMIIAPLLPRYGVHEEMVLKRESMSRDAYKAMELAFRCVTMIRVARQGWQGGDATCEWCRLIADVEHMLYIKDDRVNVLGVPVTEVLLRRAWMHLSACMCIGVAAQ